ncbi:MAG TPA: hypothetical protein VMV78_07480 [Thiobacillus sp.]|nr:hypothetical protein [Thiobacillus sp.]
MSNLSQDLTAAIAAIHDADAQDLVAAAKAILHGEPNDAADFSIDVLAREARERIEYGDDPDPMLADVLAIRAEYFS